MKKFFVLSSMILALGACSSADKKNMDDSKMAAKEKVEEAKKDAKGAMADAKDAAATASKSTCKLGEDTRIIEVKKTDTGGCELFYTKFGEAKSVASSGFGSQYCEEVKDRIQSNLAKAGFKCE